MNISFSDLQNKLITAEKMNFVHAAILAADIVNDYSDSAKNAVSNWLQGEDISAVMIGDASIADITDELNCTQLQAVCILNAIEKDPEIFADAVLALWKDEIR